MSSLCAPAKAGTAAGAATGLVVWLLVSFVPAFRHGVPEPVSALIPFVLAWAGHTLASLLTPHPAPPAGSPR